jgi:hypothetical protein
VEEIDERPALKGGKIIASVGPDGLNQLGKTRKPSAPKSITASKSAVPIVWTPTKHLHPWLNDHPASPKHKNHF